MGYEAKSYLVIADINVRVMPGSLRDRSYFVHKRHRFNEVFKRPSSNKLAAFQTPFRVALERFCYLCCTQCFRHMQHLASAILFGWSVLRN